MKCMLLLWIATLFNICHADTIANSPPAEEVTTFAQQAKQKAEQYFDFKTGYFKPNITEQQKQQFYNDLLDSLVTTKEELYRFDRREPQPFISEPYRKKQEQDIQKMADTCVQYIGAEPQDKDNDMLTLKQGDTVITTHLNLPTTRDSKEVLKHIQNNYLQGRIYKCSHFLYGDHYSLADFEFYDYAQPKTALFRKRQMLESLYEDLYFAIRKAGLLRTIPAMYYPKSLIRNYADNKFLTQYINEKQKIASKKLNHELAIQFVGSRDKWIVTLNQFLLSSTNLLPEYRHCPKNVIGIPKAYIGSNDNPIGLPLIFVGGVKHQCKRMILSNDVLDYTDRAWLTINKYYDTRTGYFKKGITDHQKKLLFNATLDARILTNKQLYRFDRLQEEPDWLSVKEEEMLIQALLYECTDLLELSKVPVPEKRRGFYHHLTIAQINIMGHGDDHPLEILVNRCVTSLYGKNYNLKDFELSPPRTKKRYQAEHSYEKAYLWIRLTGLIRYMPSAFYPKSLVRAHADQTGLTQFMLGQKKSAGKKLDNEKLAELFFHSKKNWHQELDAFIRSKL